MPSDFVGHTLVTGDNVVFIRKGYREFSLGTINRVLPQKVEVAFKRPSGAIEYTFRFPQDVVHV